MIKYTFVYIECIRIAYIYVHTCMCVLPPSHGLPCPGRHSCPLWRRLRSHLHLADRCSFCRNGCFHFVWSPLGKVPPRCAPSAPSTHTLLLIRAEAADSPVSSPAVCERCAPADWAQGLRDSILLQIISDRLLPL